MRVFLEYVELFFATNSIEDKRQIAVFLSVIGHKNYTLHHDLQALKKPQKNSLTTLFETLRKHFEPKPVIIAEPFCFQQRDLANGESIIKHLAELQRLATHCQVRDYLDEALCDHFVYGLRSSGIQKCLLTEAESLTIKKALEVTVTVKAANQKAKKLKSSESAQPGKVEQTLPTSKNTKSCYKCGKQDHSLSDCKYQDFVC